MSQNNQYNTIEEALRDLREGKVILVTDDPDRENEGDLVNLENDVIGKYVEKLLGIRKNEEEKKESGITMKFLEEFGF